MADSFEGLTLVDNRSDSLVLEQVEDRLRSEIDARGLETLDEQDVVFQGTNPSLNDIGSQQDLQQYIDRCTGLQPVNIVLYASDSEARGTDTLVESVDTRVDIEGEIFTNAYSALDDVLNIEKASFNLTGEGKNSIEAYRSTVPSMNFLIEYEGEDALATVSYRQGGTLENIWTENDSAFEELYQNLRTLGLDYEGTTVEGQENTEWIVTDYDFPSAAERR